MQTEVEVREPKYVLVIGIIDAVFFTIFLFFCVCVGISEHDMMLLFLCGAIFGGFALLGYGMITDYCLRRLQVSRTNCQYRTWYGKTTAFYFTEIGCVEQKLRMGSLSVLLYDRSGKKLACVECNMKHSNELLDFFRQNAMTVTESDVLPKGNTPYRNKQQAYITETYPAEKELYPWQFQHVKQIKWFMRFLSWGGLFLTVVAIRYFSARTGILLMMVLPLLMYIVLLTFPNVITMDRPNGVSKEWRTDHVNFPFVTFMLIEILGWPSLEIMNIRDGWKAVGFGVIIFLIFFLLYLLFVKNKKPLYGTMAMIIMLGVFYAYTTTYHANWICRVKEPEHEVVMVTDQFETGGKSNHYVLRVATTEGEERMDVYKTMYDRVEPGDTVGLCKRVSVFGIHYWYLHEL
ncbi:MAG: hypothetical protein PHS74_13805 [Lachnospiraceae bacterium]|nr:hypothetical protein [Lachnospiraceae bacterium]